MLKTPPSAQSQRSANDNPSQQTSNKMSVKPLPQRDRPHYEARVGLFVLIAAMLLTYGWTWLHGLSILHPPQRFTIHFHDIAGLNNNATVNVNGVRVGTVEKIELLKKGDVAVSLKISTEGLNIPIPENAVFTIQTLGLVGAKYVEITLPEQAGAPLTADSPVIHGQDPVRTELIINNIATQVGSFDIKGIETKLKRDLDRIDVMANDGSLTLRSYRDTAPELHNIAKSLQKVSVKADSAMSSADTFFQSATGTTRKANKILDNPALSSDLKETATQARLTAEKIQAVMKDVKGTLGDSQVRGDVLGMLTKLQASAESIQQSIGKINTITGDQGLRTDLKEIVTKTNTALDKVNSTVNDKNFTVNLTDTMARVKNAADDLSTAAKNINKRVTGKHWLRTGVVGGGIKDAPPATKKEMKKTIKTKADGTQKETEEVKITPASSDTAVDSQADVTGKEIKTKE